MGLKHIKEPLLITVGLKNIKDGLEEYKGTLETRLTLNNARLVRELFFSKLHPRSKSTLGCYTVKTSVSVALNDALYER